jgi:hypothetical protein
MLMKQEFVLAPINGVGPVRLGASRETVITALSTPTASCYKTPESRYPTDAGFGNGFQVFYEGDQPTVAFIELSECYDFEPILFGLPVFATTTTILVREVGRRAKQMKPIQNLGAAIFSPLMS